MFENLSDKLDGIFRKLKGQSRLSEKNIKDALREVRLALLEADVNYKVAKNFIAAVQEQIVGEEVLRSLTPGQQVIKFVHEELIQTMGPGETEIMLSPTPPTIVMVVGLQGSGKTTLAAKLALAYRKRGKNPFMIAGDIYRPAAIDQLQILGRGIDIPVYLDKGERNPVTICRKGILEAGRTGRDFIIIDTAGRLHIDDEMMGELQRIRKAVSPHEILLVADSMTGQDAVNVASSFDELLAINGVVLTKMDGDTRGGAAISIKAVTGKPIKYLGTGEKLDALEIFHPDRLASRILGMGDVLTLIEKVQQNVDMEEAQKMEKKLLQDAFTFDDFLVQLQQIKKMGPFSQILDMIPGMSGKIKPDDVDPSALGKIEAIICSMTLKERRNPRIINGSRRKRISKGSGTTVQDVNRLIKQFEEMRKMIKRFKKMKMGKIMPGMTPFG